MLDDLLLEKNGCGIIDTSIYCAHHIYNLQPCSTVFSDFLWISSIVIIEYMPLTKCN